MSSEEFNLEDLLPTDAVRETVMQMLVQVDRKIAESTVNYKFMMQMIGETQTLPSADVLTMIVAKRYADALRDWDGEDMYLPFLFARLTVKEVSR